MRVDIKLQDIIKAFINAVDLVNPILKNHHRRTAVIAYYIGREAGFDELSLANLVIAASLHDVGALTVEHADALTQMDVDDPEPHAILGAGMLSHYKAFSRISKIIRHHHAVYSEVQSDAKDIPYEESFVLHLADRIEILLDSQELALNQVDSIRRTVIAYQGTLFKPAYVEAFLRISEREYFWFDIERVTMLEILERIDFDMIDVGSSLHSLEELMYTLSRIIDYKCKFTATHSIGVAYISYHLALLAGLKEMEANRIKIAGYLHDIGKIAVPSEIIGKPSALTQEEFNQVKAHPYYTYEILKNIRGMEEIAFWAGSHHEKRDLSGYPRKPEQNNLGIEVEIIAFADVFTALCENRPYRKSLDVNEALGIIEKDLVPKMGTAVFDVLRRNAVNLYRDLKQIQSKSETEYLEILWGRKQD